MSRGVVLAVLYLTECLLLHLDSVVIDSMTEFCHAFMTHLHWCDGTLFMTPSWPRTCCVWWEVWTHHDAPSLKLWWALWRHHDTDLIDCYDGICVTIFKFLYWIYGGNLWGHHDTDLICDWYDWICDTIITYLYWNYGGIVWRHHNSEFIYWLLWRNLWHRLDAYSVKYWWILWRYHNNDFSDYYDEMCDTIITYLYWCYGRILFSFFSVWGWVFYLVVCADYAAV